MTVNVSEINRKKSHFRSPVCKCYSKCKFYSHTAGVECSTKCVMADVREFIKLVCCCAICHTCASVETPYGIRKKCCCTGSLAQVRALTRDETLDKVNGNLVPRTRCLVLEALLATLRIREKYLFVSCSEPFCFIIMQTAMLQ